MLESEQWRVYSDQWIMESEEQTKDSGQ